MNASCLIVYCEQNPRFCHEVDGTFRAGAWEKQELMAPDGVEQEAYSRGFKEIHAQ